MSSLNKAMLIGRLGADPEVRYTQSNTAVATLNIATNERFKDSNGEWRERTEWHRVVAWGRLAEIVQQYVKKGGLVYIEGPIQTRQWEDKDGQKRYTTEIKALTLRMLDSRNDSGMTVDTSNSQEKTNAASKPVDLNGDFDDLDDDLPF
ncbi:MAG TPA: single-stranded DNA-binding protein [Balneolales bacterium]|nr:single-stranded DNA-binding protein [Balneolales bacterium]